jgi:hexosaminidase
MLSAGRLLGPGILFVLSAASFYCASAAEVHLLPQPREAHFSGEVSLTHGIRVQAPGGNADDLFAARQLEEAARAAGVQAPGEAAYPVELLRAESVSGKDLLSRTKLAFTPEMASEGYVIVIDKHRGAVIAQSASGVFYGVQTLKQLLPLAGAPATLLEGTIRDWPAMKYRAIDDDLSRGPFPTLDFQKHQVAQIAAFKANIYSPYFEHTLQYTSQPMAAPVGGALSPADAAELVKFAEHYHVTILPEQEAFGHVHHVLKYDVYQDVAETPHGYVLAPGQPQTLPLIKDWFTQIAAEFPSPWMHIGADETFDLGLGRTSQQVKAQGYGPVYVQFLTQIHDALAPLHKKLMFWGDIGTDDPKAVVNLPKDMIAVPWDYGSTKGFDKMIEPFAKAGIETWVAPGDANWSTVYPDANVFFGNIQGFIRDGQKYGSTGALTTVWNDDGEGLFNQDWYGVIFGAVAAWQPGESSIADYQAAYGATFHGDATGKVNQAEKELMLANETLGKTKTDFNSDTIFWLDPWSAEGKAFGVKLLPLATELRLHAENAVVLLAQARAANPNLREQDALLAMDLGARRLDLIGMKYELSDEIVKAYAQVLTRQHDREHTSITHNLLDGAGGGNGRIEDLRDAYSNIKDEYRQVWLSENRPYWLGSVMVRYDLQIQKWEQRSMRMGEATRMFEQNKEMPTAADLGMPQ